MYGTTARNLRELGDSLDASAMRTRGLVPPPNPGLLFTILTNPGLAAKFLLIFIILAVIVLGVVFHFRGRRAPPPRRVPRRPYRPNGRRHL